MLVKLEKKKNSLTDFIFPFLSSFSQVNSGISLTISPLDLNLLVSSSPSPSPRSRQFEWPIKEAQNCAHQTG